MPSNLNPIDPDRNPYQQCVEISQAVSVLLTNLLLQLEEQRQTYVDGIKALAKRTI